MLIGLNGRAESGKDTVCKILQTCFPSYGIERESFADRLKLSAARCFYPTIPQNEAIDFCNDLKVSGVIMVADEQDGEHTVITGREFLQHYGTEAHRDVFGYDFWVRQVITEDIEDHEGVIVVTDVRFDNEAKAIKDAGGHIWWIDRPSVKNGDTHASEAPLPEELIDFTIDNSGTLEELKARVAVAFAHELAAVA